jgi:hypothetical protein
MSDKHHTVGIIVPEYLCARIHILLLLLLVDGI